VILNHIFGKWFDLILNPISDDFWIPCPFYKRVGLPIITKKLLGRLWIFKTFWNRRFEETVPLFETFFGNILDFFFVCYDFFWSCGGGKPGGCTSNKYERSNLILSSTLLDVKHSFFTLPLWITPWLRITGLRISGH
jgi:hypothetical protein